MRDVDAIKMTRNHPHAAPRQLTGTRWRHVKRRSTYRVLHEAKLQSEWIAHNARSLDMIDMIVCQCEHDLSVWVWPVSEFLDGRFEQLESYT